MAIAAFAAIALVSAGAQAAEFSESRVIDTLDDATLQATFDHQNIKWQMNGEVEGAALYVLDFPDGMKAFAYLRACEGAACNGLVLLAAFEATGLEIAVLDDLIMNFDDLYPAGKAYRGEDGASYVQAYVITDGGITLGNLVSQINVFDDITREFSSELYN